MPSKAAAAAQPLKQQAQCGCILQVENKLSAVVAQWAATEFAFADFKTHGPVALKVDPQISPQLLQCS